MAMRKLRLIIFLILIIPSFSWAACPGTCPETPADCFTGTTTKTVCDASYAAVNATIGEATYGDTINIPAGEATWSDTITTAKDLIIKGAGVGSTILKSDFGATTHKAFFFFDTDATTRGRLENRSSGEGMIEVMGITFSGDGQSGGDTYHDGIAIANFTSTPIRRVKIHHNKFDTLHRAIDLGAGPSLSPGGNVWGVFYSNELVSTNGSYVVGSDTYSWNTNPVTAGSGDGMYFEDNTWSSCASECSMSGGGHGGSHIMRYNTMESVSSIGQAYWESHGNQTGGLNSMQVTEAYGNNLPAPVIQGINHRGGKGFFLFNKMENAEFRIWEEMSDTVAGTTYDDKCAEDTPQLCNVGGCRCQKPNDVYMVGNRKTSDNALSTVFISFDCIDRYAEPLHSQCYSVDGTVYGNTDQELVANREYFNHVASGFDGSVGVGCGELADIPSSCTVGVGYWATSDTTMCTDLTGYVGAQHTKNISGSLYKCTATDTWTPSPYYTPYTYPHPLRGSGGGGETGSGPVWTLGTGAVATFQ
jgi:hypothetical protein